MKLSNEKPSSSSFFSLSTIRKLALPALALISITAGIVAGGIFRTNHKDSSAASANITVRDNDQTIEQDQSTGEIIITRTSIVTIKNPEANYGYTLSAKLTTIPNATVTIASPTSTDCPTDTPCPLNTSAPITILTTTDNTATETNGDTTTFTVTITIPAEAPVSDYILDIEYQEEANPIPPGPTDPGTTHGAMQSLTNENCPTTDLQTAFDARNNQIYYVKKIGGLCWMLSNLRYGGDGNYDSAWDWDDDRYATTASNSTATDNDDDRPLTTVSGSQASSYAVAQIADPRGDTDYTNTTASGGFYGYLYNWCAAMGGQPNACNNTSTTGFDTSISICPAGWRLPTGGGSGEFQTLITALGNPANGAALNTSFLAVYSGAYGSGLGSQGSSGSIWSSTVNSTTYAYYLGYSSSNINPAYYANKYNGIAVRCVR